MDEMIGGSLERWIDLVEGPAGQQAQLTGLGHLLRELQAARQELTELRAGQQATIDEALRRQAAAVCRRVELSDSAGPELEAVLALVPAEYNLQVSGAEPVATWEHHVRPELQASCSGPTRETAIRAATVKLLGPSACQTCLHWQRDAKPAASGDGTARPCGIGGELRHPAGGRDCDRFEAADQSDTEPAPSSGEQPCAVICLGLELARCDKEKP
jgi:hypothetical protein